MVIFYEVVSDTGSDLGDFTASPLDPWNGIGYITSGSGGAVFSTGGSPVTGSAAPKTVGSAAGAGATNTGGTLDATPFVANAAAKLPTSTFQSLGAFVFDPPNRITPGGHSTILVLASSSKPAGFEFGSGSLDSVPGNNPTVSLPVTNPEPGTLALLSVAGVFGGVGAWRRRKAKQAAVETAA